MISYNESVINEFAEKLYKTADDIVNKNMISFGIIGALLGYILGSAILGSKVGILIAIFTALISAYIGYQAGEAKAFVYRLQAQTALCQVQIEKNTREKVYISRQDENNNGTDVENIKEESKNKINIKQNIDDQVINDHEIKENKTIEENALEIKRKYGELAYKNYLSANNIK